MLDKVMPLFQLTIYTYEESSRQKERYVSTGIRKHGNTSRYNTDSYDMTSSVKLQYKQN